MKKYEEALKTIMEAERNVTTAGRTAISLDDKVGFERLRRAFGGVIKTLRSNYYEYENALKVAKTAIICSECGEVQPGILNEKNPN